MTSDLPPQATDANSVNTDEVLVRVEGVSKKFCRSLKKSLWYGVQDIAAELHPFRGKSEKLKSDSASEEFNHSPEKRPLRDGEFWAVNDVSFELRRGECLGLIGHNGAGKTSLLKMLNGLIKPDKGSVEMRGRVGALIALGAGFNPILTGRENIYVNGSILGLSKKEIDAKLDEIIDFAEIGEFIDAPVQSYSSGMAVRLGFAVATATDPDILMLDEVLAVGDAAFRAKCFARIGSLQKKTAIIFVSHSMDQVARLCRLALYLEGGRTPGVASVERAAEQYEARSSRNTDGADASFERITHPIQTLSYSCQQSVELGSDLDFHFTIETTEAVSETYFRLVFFSPDGAHCGELNSKFANLKWPLKAGHNEFVLTCHQLSLRPGRYKVGLMFFAEKSIEPLIWIYKRLQTEVTGPRLGLSPYALNKASLAQGQARMARD